MVNSLFSLDTFSITKASFQKLYFMGFLKIKNLKTQKYENSKLTKVQKTQKK